MTPERYIEQNDYKSYGGLYPEPVVKTMLTEYSTLHDRAVAEAAWDACVDYRLRGGFDNTTGNAPNKHQYLNSIGIVKDEKPLDTLREWMSNGRNITRAAECITELVMPENFSDNTYEGTQTRIEEYICTEMFKDVDFNNPVKDEWISVEDRMPEPLLGVLVFIPEEDFHVTSGMWDVSKKWVLLDEYRVPECSVTHWKPLDEIPEPYRTEQKEHGKILNWLKGNLPQRPIK